MRLPLTVLVSTLVVTTCSMSPALAADAPNQAPAAAADGAALAPPGGGVMAPPAAGQTVTGPVLETMNAGNYTYVRVKTDAGDIWAATNQFEVAVGDRVVVPLQAPMQNFHSPSLNRDFPVIYFASRIWREGTPGPSALPPMASAHGATGGTAMGGPAMGGRATGEMMGGHSVPSKTPPVVTKLDPPAGGMSIADVWAKRTALTGKTVTVRGTVVKFNAGIMGRNWFHLQDGSGVAKDGTHDLTITSPDAVAKVGDVVTATGVVAVDKDFTAGYQYPVMLEDAKISAN